MEERTSVKLRSCSVRHWVDLMTDSTGLSIFCPPREVLFDAKWLTPRGRKRRHGCPGDGGGARSGSSLLAHVHEEETQRLHRKSDEADESISSVEDDLSLREPWVERKGWAKA